MAHNLATIEGKVSMMYTQGNPWHSLGHKLPESTTYQEAIEAASLNWDAKLAPLYLGDGSVFPNAQAVLRYDGEILGVAGEGYQTIQYRDAFSVVEPLIDSGDMVIASAGSLGKGEVGWLLLKNQTGIKIGESEVQTYLVVMTSHNRTKSLQALPTGVYVVCQNTLNMVKGNATIRIRHTSNAKDKIEEAKRILASFSKAKTQAYEIYSRMADKVLTVDQLLNYWSTVFPVKSKAQEKAESEVDQLLASVTPDVVKDKDTNQERQEMCQYLLEHGKGQNGTPTVWNVYNCVTEYLDHIYPNKQDGSERVNGLQSAVLGGGTIIRDKAWDKALSLL